MIGLGLGLVVAAAIGTAAFVIHGREQTFTDMFGDPDTGPYDFDNPTRSDYPNDALACPRGFCTEGRPDLEIAPLRADVPDVYRAVRAAIEAFPSPDVRRDDPAEGEFRAVVRTPWIRFPDTVSARVRRLADGTTGLWLYSRSRLGRNDLGTNRRRVETIVDRVRADVEAALSDPARPRPRS